MKITYYLEVISSWCYWAEPSWAELKRRYAGRVEFTWKIAHMTAEAYPQSPTQCDWFYRRSGTIMRSPFMLNSGWFEPDIKEYRVPNLVAEAGKDFGVTDDRIRLAIAHAGVREGRKVGRWEESVAAGAGAAGLDPKALLARAQSPEIATRTDATTAEFHALQVTQRPTFVIENSIGDSAVLSGMVKVEPLIAVIEAQMADEAGYVSHRVHFGNPPPS
ncbi:MAG: disulfide bond formation protein DsbA [Pedosphaera sp.]|nr:disulfide bond formation protein DsbA [Pedosphaera sp.]